MKLQQQYSIPMCYLPNSKKQIFNPDSCLCSDFQVQQLWTVSQRDDFAYFVLLRKESIIDERSDGAVPVMWYDKLNNMYYANLGTSEFIGSDGWLVSSCNKDHPNPVVLDHIIYQIRCNLDG